MKLAISLIAAIFMSAAHADIVVNKVSNPTGIAIADVYSVIVSGAKPSLKDVSDEVASRIRYGYYREGGVIEGWSLERTTLAQTLKTLGDEDGQFKRISERELDLIGSWIEDKQVKSTVYKMTVDSSWFGATAVTVHYILLPTDYSEPILVLSYNRYAEE